MVNNMEQETVEQLAQQIALLADKVADCKDLDASDRNTTIGKLRNVAAFMIGAKAMPPFRQAPFTPTTKTPSPDNLPNTPPRT